VFQLAEDNQLGDLEVAFFSKYISFPVYVEGKLLDKSYWPWQLLG
jgi:hypothetical protein